MKRWRRLLFSAAAMAMVMAIAAIIMSNGDPRVLLKGGDDSFKAATSVVIYDVEGLHEHSSQQLARATSAPMDAEEFRSLVAHAEHRRRHALWKGSSLAVVTLDDGREIHLAISYYGGFFKVLGELGHWSLPDADRDRFIRAYREILYGEFIPPRTRD